MRNIQLERELRDRSRIDRLNMQLSTLAALNESYELAKRHAEATHAAYMSCRSPQQTELRKIWQDAANRLMDAEKALADAGDAAA
jgi:hypothetical protein